MVSLYKGYNCLITSCLDVGTYDLIFKSQKCPKNKFFKGLEVREWCKNQVMIELDIDCELDQDKFWQLCFRRSEDENKEIIKQINTIYYGLR